MNDSQPTPGIASTADSVDDAGAAIRPPPLAAITKARPDDPSLRVLVAVIRLATSSDRSAIHRVARVVGTLISAAILTFAIDGVLQRFFGVRVTALACPMFAVVAWATFRLLRVADARHLTGPIARSIVAEGLCGQCLYELVGTTTQTSGLFKCPECGAAWLAERWRPRTLALARRHASDPNAAAPTASDRDAFLRWCLTHRRPERIIVDDRGNFTYAPKSWLDDFPGPSGSETERDARARLACEIRAMARPRRQKVIAMIALLALIVVSFATWVILGDRSLAPDEVVFPLLFLVLVAAVIVAVNGSELGIPPREVALCLASSGRCGACAQSLHDAPIESGLRVCTKCHAAWYWRDPRDA